MIRLFSASPLSPPAMLTSVGSQSSDAKMSSLTVPAERAKSLKKAPAYVLGCGQSVTHASISSMSDLTVTGALTAGKAAYAMAKLGPADIDAVELYDAFTINTILFL